MPGRLEGKGGSRREAAAGSAGCRRTFFWRGGSSTQSRVTQTSLSLGICPWKERRGVPIRPSVCPPSLLPPHTRLLVSSWLYWEGKRGAQQPGKASQLKSWGSQTWGKSFVERVGPDGCGAPPSEILGREIKVGTYQAPSAAPASAPGAAAMRSRGSCPRSGGPAPRAAPAATL